MLKRALEDSVTTLGVRIPTMAWTVLLCIAIIISVWLENKDDFTTRLHPFVLYHHTSLVRKALHAKGENYNLVAGRTGTTVTNAEIISVPNGVVLNKNLILAWVILERTHENF